YIQIGTDLFSKDHNDLIAFRNGDFMTKDYPMVKGVFYDNHTGEKLDETDELNELKDKVEHELSLSDRVLQGDLLRFYQPFEDWEPINSKDYFYDNEQLDISDELINKWVPEYEEDS